jgi:hypothetical protein
LSATAAIDPADQVKGEAENAFTDAVHQDD